MNLEGKTYELIIIYDNLKQQLKEVTNIKKEYVIY
jgi:hypothetical protein